ncbi:MAG: hypothetical protein DME53_05540 [Verrucomicrobia bacterium]|nr:MAG: hypothetical protein DME53_05540 [Verrucomicrobiota bacterium]
MKIYLKKFVLGQVTLIFTLACFALSPTARAVTPAPDGGYPNDNTAEGEDALFDLDVNNSTDNTAVGFDAMSLTTVTFGNTAVGSQAMEFAGSGSFNVAIGFEALFQNGPGNDNTAVGASAMGLNGFGNNNTAMGNGALFFNTNGNSNTCLGFNALNNATGSSNIALGSEAGINLTTGSNNIDIGNKGKAGESQYIRIGTKGTQTHTLIAGISGATVAGGVGVIIDTNGHLGTVVSSERFKDAIEPMDKASEAILALKPVTFHYKHELDPEGIPQFGLVAEEVEKVNPDLVARDAEGKPYTVRYEAVNAMLLNEFLKEHKAFAEERCKVQEQGATIVRLEKQVEMLSTGLQKVSAQLELSKPPPQTVSNNH